MVFCWTHVDKAVAEAYQSLLAQQQPLGEDFAKVLYDNLWDMFIVSSNVVKTDNVVEDDVKGRKQHD